VTQVNNDQFFACVEFSFIHPRNARDAQIAQKTLASGKFIGDIRAGHAEQKHQKPAAKKRDAPLPAQSPAENIARPRKEPAQRKDPAASKKQNGADACERCRLGEGRRCSGLEETCEQPAREPPCLKKNAFGVANAGIRLKRDFAEKLKDLAAFAAAKLIPEWNPPLRQREPRKKARRENPSGQCQRARRPQQQRHRGNRQAYLLAKPIRA